MGTPFAVSRVGGVPFQSTTFAEAVAWVVDVAANDHLAVNVRLANAWNVALADKNASYHDLLSKYGVNFPDGAPVAWFMNKSRGARPKAQRVRGPSFFTAVMQAGCDRGIRHFLLGGSPETLVNLRANLEKQYPGVLIVGTHSPPFAPVDDNYIAECAASTVGTGADLVWVGLGTPKQDITGTALANALGITTINVGAAFDFHAGRIVEAPQWIQRSGFEWLFRLLAEPRRLWRRYLIGNFQFVWAAVRGRRTERAVSRTDS